MRRVFRMKDLEREGHQTFYEKKEEKDDIQDKRKININGGKKMREQVL